jgi:hypothetical protein
MFPIRSIFTRLAVTLLAGLSAQLHAAEPPTPVPAGTPVTITVQPPAPATPPFSIVLKGRHGHVVPIRAGCTHTGGGNIDIAQPSSDTLVVTMSGAAVAYPFYCSSSAVMDFMLDQCFEITFDNPKVKKAKITMEGRVIGLLRSHCKGTASFDNASADIVTSQVPIIHLGGVVGHDLSGEAVQVSLLHLGVPGHSVSGCDNLSVNDHQGPVSVPITAGKYVLHQTFQVGAATPCCIIPFKGPSSEFAPDPAIDPLWLSYKEPFHGAAKKDFGFQVTVKVIEDTETAEASEKTDKGEQPGEQPPREKLPEPTLVPDK